MIIKPKLCGSKHPSLFLLLLFFFYKTLSFWFYLLIIILKKSNATYKNYFTIFLQIIDMTNSYGSITNITFLLIITI